MRDTASKIVYSTVGATFGFVFAILLVLINEKQVLKWFEILFQGLVGSLIVGILILYLTQTYQDRQDKAKLINKSLVLIGEIAKHRRFLISLRDAASVSDAEGYVRLGAHLSTEWEKLKYDLHDLPDKLERVMLLHYSENEAHQKIIENNSLAVLIANKPDLIKKITRTEAILEGLYSITDPEPQNSHWKAFELYYNQYVQSLKQIANDSINPERGLLRK